MAEPGGHRSDCRRYYRRSLFFAKVGGGQRLGYERGAISWGYCTLSGDIEYEWLCRLHMFRRHRTTVVFVPLSDVPVAIQSASLAC